MKMKTIKQITIIAIFSFIAWSCEQENVMKVDPTAVAPTAPSGSAGSADFTKFSAMGGSFEAGFMDGTLYTNGQKNSLAAMVASQINYTRDAATQAAYTFNQPDINSDNGYVNAGDDGIPGTADDNGRTYLTQSASTGAIGIGFADGDLASVVTPYAGDKTALNNFSFGNSVMGMYLTEYAGGPNPGANPALNPAYNAYYARFAAAPGVASPIAQFMGSAPSFFMVSLGTSDFVAYAARGGDINQAPKPDAATLGTYFAGILATPTGLVGANPIWKGVMSTVPDLLAMPYFHFIAYNAIPLDAASATAANAGFASFNGILTGAAGAGLLTTSEAAARQLTWAAGNNAILINDSTLTDLLPVWMALVGAGVIPADDLNMNGIPDAVEQLSPYRYARMATANDKPILSAQTVLGTAHPVYTTATIGVSWPLEDGYIMTAAELVEYETLRAAVNTSIKTYVAVANSTVALNPAGLNRVALVDLDGTFAAWASSSPIINNGVVVTYDFAPPTGMFSTDGIHLNARGYALLANKWIDAINSHFGSTIPAAKVGWYPGPALPVTVE